MARISTYPRDTYVTGLDKWIGSDANTENFATKNFTANAVADYFNRSAIIDTGQFSWTFAPFSDTQPQAEKSFQQIDHLNQSINILSLAAAPLRVSVLTLANTTPGIFIVNEWVGQAILIHVPSGPSQYAIYNVVSVVPDTEWFFIMELELVSGVSATIQQGESLVFGYYNAANAVTEVKATFPILVEGTTEPTISLDVTTKNNWNTAYSRSLVSASVTGTTTKTLTLTEQGGGTITTSWVDDNTDAVTSVFGRTGAVVAQSGDYTTTLVTEGTNLYFTDQRARNVISSSITGIEYSNTTGIFSLTTGYLIPTTTKSGQWDTAYNRSLTSAAVTGTTTKTLTLNQQDGGTITASWTDVNTDAVTSVFGRTGVVVAESGDYTTTLVTEGTNLYFTSARARSAISLTTTGTSGAATYDSATGVLNVPQYQGGVTSFNTRTGAITLTSGDVTGALTFTPENVANKSNDTALGTSATLYPTQNAVKVYVDSATAGGIILQGDWNASTNVPDITGTTQTGFAWRVSVAGNTSLGGITDWLVGDLAVKSATGWIKIDNTESVTSVFGRFGTVVAQSGDYTSDQVTEGTTNLYYTNARSRAALSITTTGTTGAATYNSTTGVFNIPNYTTDVSGYVPYTGATSAVNLGAYDLTVNELTIGKGTSGLSNNTALGHQALFHITTGNYNTGVGHEALHNTSTGAYNTAIGQSSLFTNTTGGQNTAIGINALLSNTSGGSNTALGLDSLQHNTTGSSNVALGYNAGSHITGGTTPNTVSGTSIYIGRDTRAAADGGANEIVIGNATTGNGSNTVTIGNSSITANYLKGSVNAGSFIKTGGTSSQFLKADGSVDSTAYGTGTVTSVGLTLGTTGTDANISNSPITSTGEITLNLPTASATNRGLLSNGDWTTFNSKQTALNGNGFVKVAGTTVSYITGSSSQFVKADGTLDSNTYLTTSAAATTYVPYTGANANVNLGAFSLTATSLIKSGGTSAQILAADGSVLTAGTNITISGGTISASGGGGGSSARTEQTFTATTGTNTLTVAGGYTVGLIDVYVNGVKYAPSDFTATTSPTVVITGLVAGDIISIISYTSSITALPTSRDVFDYTATAGQTTFTVTGGYTAGLLDVYVNGVKLTSTEVTATNGTTFVLTVASVVGDQVQAIRYNSSITGISGSGTTNYVPKFTATGTIGNSLIYSNATNVGINTTSPNSQFEVYGSTGGALTDGIRVSRNTLQTSQYGVINYASGILNITGVNTSGGGEMRLNTSDGTTTSERVRLSSTGNVGISNTSPNDAYNSGGWFSASGLVIGNTSSNAGLQIVSSPTSTLSAIRWGNGSNGGLYDQGFINYNSSTSAMAFGTSRNTAMTISANGSIGAPSGTNIYNASDIRLKRNVESINNGLNKVMDLNPVKFNWIEKYEPSEEGKDMLGFIAQEVKLIIPEAVEDFASKTVVVGDQEISDVLRINEKFIIPVLVSAIQELSTKLDEANTRLQLLENK